MTLRSPNGVLEGMRAMRPKLRLIRSSCRTKIEMRRLAAVATRILGRGRSSLINEPKMSALLTSVTATRTR